MIRIPPILPPAVARRFVRDRAGMVGRGRHSSRYLCAERHRKPYGDFILLGAANLSAGPYLRHMKIEQKRKVRLIPHQAVLDTGSFEVAYPDGRPSDFFYFEDSPGRRLRPDVMTRPEAQRAAQAKARQEQDALDRN